jgi:hypothetical protein
MAQTDHEGGTVMLRVRVVAVVCRHTSTNRDKALTDHRAISVHVS